MHPRKSSRSSRGLLFAAFCSALFAAGGAFAREPAFLKDSTGRIYLPDNGRIMQIDTVRQRLEPVTRNIAAKRLMVDGNNNVYAPSMRYDPRVDLFRPTMWRYSPGGGVTEASPTSPEDFSFSEVADSDGNLYFWQVDSKRNISRIVKRTKDGDLVQLAGKAWGIEDGRGADAKLSRIGGLTVGPNDDVYFTDDQSVRKLSQDGCVTTIARGGQLSLGAGRSPENHLAAIAVDDQRRIFVADRVTHRIFLVSQDGEVSTITYSNENWHPSSIAWSNGALYVLESGPEGNRVIRVTTDGERSELDEQRAGVVEPQEKPLRLSDSSDIDPRAAFLPMFFMPVARAPWIF